MKKKRKVKEEPEEEELIGKAKKPKGVAKEYDTNRQPLWVSDPKWDHMFQLNGDGVEGQRIYLYRGRGFMIVANKDWEKEGGRLPGKSVRIKLDDFEQFMVDFMKTMYGYKFQVEKK